MPDDRSSGFLGGGSVVRFNSADNSGSVSGIPNKKRSKNQQHPFDDEEKDDKKEEFRSSEAVDNSSLLKATLNSLASLNFAKIIKKNKIKKTESED